jgi:hypothetical protein
MVRTSNLSKVFEFVDIYNKFSYYKRAVSKISLDFNLGMRFNRNLQVVEEVLDALRYRQQDWCSAMKEIMALMIEVSGDIKADQLVRIQHLTNICPYSTGLYLRNTFMRLTKDFISKGKSLATSNESVDLVSAYRYLILGGSAHGLSVTRNLSSNPQFQQPQFQLNEIEQLAMRVVDHLTAQELWEQATMQANDLRKRYSSSVVFEDMPGIIKTRYLAAERNKKELRESKSSKTIALHHRSSEGACTETSTALNRLDKRAQRALLQQVASYNETIPSAKLNDDKRKAKGV